MAFAAARPNSETMSDINITPLVDVMLVLLVIFMVTAPLMDFRIGMSLPQSGKKTPPALERQLTVEPGDLFRLDGTAVSPRELQVLLADWNQLQPEGVLKLQVSAEADYQSAATAMATARRAGIVHIALGEP